MSEDATKTMPEIVDDVYRSESRRVKRATFRVF